MATICIKTMGGGSEEQKFENLDLSITVGQFKDMIEARLSMPKATQRIIFQGRVLTDDVTLASSGLADGMQVHLVSLQARPAQAQTPAAPAPNRNLFSGGGNGGSGGGAPFEMPSGPEMEDIADMLRTPMGQQMLQAMLQNPEALMQQIPELRNNPELAATIQHLAQNPEAVQRLIENQVGSARPRRVIPRDVFNVAMDVMNGAELPAEYRVDLRTGARPSGGAAAARSVGSTGSAAAVSPATATATHPEIISREQINAALDACLLMLPPQPDAGPVAMNTEEGAASDVATQASAETVQDPDSVMEDATDQTPAPDPTPASNTSSLATQYATQLEQLRAMGFADDALSLQALEAGGGEVMAAVAFLTEM